MGVEVFKIGTHTDSQGREIEVTTADLDEMVDAFNSGSPDMVPVKFGHSSGAFNTAQAAELLGISEGLITGEGEDGDGAILPGKVIKLFRDQTVLKADLDVIAPVAGMIMDGLLKGISIEKPVGAFVLAAVTLLGAQRPAVKDLEPLQAATILKEAALFASMLGIETAKIQSQAFHTAEERLRSISFIGMDLGLGEDATIGNVITRLQEIKKAIADDSEQFTEDSDMDEQAVKAIREALGISEDADILEGITALKTPKPSFAERVRAKFSLSKDASDEEVMTKLEEAPAITSEDQGFAERDAKIASLERENTVRRYSEQTRNFGAVQGTPEELGTILADLDAKIGPDAVARQLKDWETQQSLSAQAGITVPSGHSQTGAPADWEGALSTWKEANPKPADVTQDTYESDATKAVMAAQPDLYGAYYKARQGKTVDASPA